MECSVSRLGSGTAIQIEFECSTTVAASSTCAKFRFISIVIYLAQLGLKAGQMAWLLGSQPQNPGAKAMSYGL